MKDQEKETSTKRFNKYIVCIGASAGGLEAIHDFFDHMPQSSSFSFVVIQHLSPDHKSLLVELVGKHTHMKVFEAEHDMAIQDDCVYIIPNNKIMTISQGRLILADKSLIKAPNTAIDSFLHTLAKDKKDKAIAIILSGTGTDGTKGIESIKANGGLVIVQDPATAKFDGMPNSAIASGNVDYVLAPSDIQQELFNYVNEEPVKVLENGRIDDQLLDRIFEMVHQQSGNQFNLYKTPTIIRRIGRRMNEKGIKSLDQYVRCLSNDPLEVKKLGQDFLIGVTSFFRDPQSFEILENNIIPEIIRKKSDDEIIKIWVCACSTGQEAYSLAVLTQHCLEKAGRKLEVKIFATDIDEKSIEIAARNQYPLSIANEVPEHLLKKYFVTDGHFYSVVPELRKQVVFAKHDVTKSPPFIKNDLITCRNMLIYMNSLLQEKILSTFHFSLCPDGYLFLGSSESAMVIKDGMSEVSNKGKIYQKSGPLNYSTFNTYKTGERLISSDTIKTRNNNLAVSSTESRFNKFITQDLGYAGVFIDQGYIIQEAVGNYKQFLSLPELKIELNLLKMVPKDVSVVLNNALRKAWKENKKVHINKVRFQLNDESVFLNISIQPPKPDSNLTLIVFGESLLEVVPDKDEMLILSSLSTEHQNEYIFELEAELSETRRNLQLVIEEMETTNEELQSTNEELLSANEELQSGNEELQSLNEELHTLNTEHQIKIRELTELNDDLDNYFRSTDIGQVFLDAQLFIRKFNPAAVSLVNLIEADIGRSIEQISNNIISEDLIADVRSVLIGGRVVEKEVLLRNGNRSLMRIMPYVRKDKKNDGVVITFVDISRITELNNIINGVFNASLNGILAFTSVRNKDHTIVDFKCFSYNEAALTLLGRNKEELDGVCLVKQIPELSDGNLFSRFIQLVEKGKTLQSEFQLSGGRWVQLVAVKMADGFVATVTDITQQKIAEQKLKKNYNELVAVKENLKRLNTDLEVKIEERTQELSASEERFKQVSRATNDTIWDWSLVDNTMWRSDNFSSMFGYESEQASNDVNFWFDKVHPDDRQRVRDSIFAAINHNEKQWSAQYRVQKGNGEYATILDRGTIMHDDFQTPFRMVGSMVDVTRLIEAETKLSSTEKRFKNVFDSNLIGMLFFKVESVQVIDANKAFLDMIGYSAEEIILSDFKLTDITPAQHRAISRTAYDQLKSNGFCPPFEMEFKRKDGTLISVMIGSAMLEEGNDSEAVTYIIDISEQKEAERRRNELQRLIKKQQDEFYSIFKNAPAFITIRRGTNLVYEFVNKAFVEFNGENNYIGRPSKDFLPEYHVEEILTYEQRVLSTGETVVASAFPIVRKEPHTGEEQEFWFDFIYTPVFNEQDQVDGIAFFGFDVTDLVKAQEATNELMHKKDEFMSIASHELKTPITSIKGFLQLASRVAQKTGHENLVSFLSKANRQVGNLTSLVDDLLDVTKIQAGKMQFNNVMFNMKDLIVECVEDIQNTEDYSITIPHLDDVEVYGDQRRIEQVINNFLSNAIKYSPDIRKAEVFTEIIDNEIKVTVKDFGIGIAADKVDLVFNRFIRVHDSSRMFSGLGLGLYISAEIIYRHHGTVGVDSVVDEGSSFWFKIPLRKQDSELN